jgi:WhiB family redox-sensing transcriptional regulator
MFDTTDAACKDMPTDMFFPSGEEIAVKTQRAIKVCNSCPIAVQCLTWAIANEDYGVWGGTTATERKELRRSPKRRSLLLKDMIDERS